MGIFTSLPGFNLIAGQSVAWRPPQFGQKSRYSLTCTLPPAASVTATSTVGGQSVPESGSGGTPSQSPTTYFFDLVGRVEHMQELTVTKHPVQLGPAIVDHAYLQPARIVMEVAASDAMASLVAGQYSSNLSKSVSMYKTFKRIQAARVPITLTTRLDTYTNLVLTDVRAVEDKQTMFGFRGTLYFEQIFTDTTNLTNTSDRPNQTGATNEGTKAPVPPTTGQTTAVDDLGGVP